jgi:hypothetical protein
MFHWVPQAFFTEGVYQNNSCRTHAIILSVTIGTEGERVLATVITTSFDGNRTRLNAWLRRHPSHIEGDPLVCPALSDALRLHQICIATMLHGWFVANIP